MGTRNPQIRLPAPYCGPLDLEGADGAPARVPLSNSLAVLHDPLDQEMTADPSAVTATKVAPV